MNSAKPGATPAWCRGHWPTTSRSPPDSNDYLVDEWSSLDPSTGRCAVG